MSTDESMPGQESNEQKGEKKQASLAIEVVIQTPDYEIEGLIHVSRNTRKDRRLTELLNDLGKRFLAVTDAKLKPKGTEGTPRLYRFLQIRLDDIQMIHPAVQAVSMGANYSNQESERFNSLRSKLGSGSAQED
jgi:hypothetical protein